MRLTARGRRVFTAAASAAALTAGSAGFYGLMLLVTAVTGPDIP